MDTNKAMQWAKLALTICIVVGLLIFIANQWLGYFEKSKLLMTSCQLCCSDPGNAGLSCPKPGIDIRFPLNISGGIK